jgi:hypothetical protein
MRLQQVKLVKIKFSIAINVEFQPRGNPLIVNGFSKCTEQVTDGVCCGSAMEISLEGSVG